MSFLSRGKAPKPAPADELRDRFGLTVPELDEDTLQAGTKEIVDSLVDHESADEASPTDIPAQLGRVTLGPQVAYYEQRPPEAPRQ